MIKTILIDGYGQRVRQMHILPSFHDIESVLGDEFWHVQPVVLDNGDMVYHSTPREITEYGAFSYQGMWYHGKALIARVDCYSALTDCKTDLAAVRPCVEWK